MIDWIEDLKIYDGTIVKFYPYSSLSEYYIDCYIVFQEYAISNIQAGLNVKLFGVYFFDNEDFLTENNNLGLIEFYDGAKLDLSENVEPIRLLNVETKSVSVKSNLDKFEYIRNNQYAEYEFNIVSEIFAKKAGPFYLNFEDLGSCGSGIISPLPLLNFEDLGSCGSEIINA